MTAFRGRKRAARRTLKGRTPFYPNHLIRVLMAAAATVAAVALLSAFLPPALGPVADPLAGPGAGIRPSWFLKPVLLLERAGSPGFVNIILILSAAALFFLTPFLDRPGRNSRARRILVWTPLLLWIAYLGLSVLLPAAGGLP